MRADIFSLYFQLISFFVYSAMSFVVLFTDHAYHIPFSNALMLFRLKASGKPLLYDKIGVYRVIQFFLVFFLSKI